MCISAKPKPHMDNKINYFDVYGNVVSYTSIITGVKRILFTPVIYFYYNLRYTGIESGFIDAILSHINTLRYPEPSAGTEKEY